MTQNAFIRFVKDLIHFGLENTLGRYYSTYRGIVSDNDDPKNYNRLKLTIPDIMGPDEVHDYWAYPHNNFSGKGYGVQVIPGKGDIVWVQFEGGDVRKPVWSHGHFGKGEKPTIDKNLTDKKSYWFVTPGQAMVKINDTDKEIKIYAPEDYTTSLVNNKSISLGKDKVSDYHAVLGEPLQSTLLKLQATLTDLTTALNKDILASVGQPYLLFPAKSKIQVPLTMVKLDEVKDELGKILSNLVTLDK